jgi:hypothetical protein
MQTGLAEAWWSRVCDEAEEIAKRLAAADNLASSLSSQGKHAEAERIHREVLGAKRRVLGEEHPKTLTSAGILASLCLSAFSADRLAPAPSSSSTRRQPPWPFNIAQCAGVRFLASCAKRLAPAPS